jgi:hypothetical protein
MSTNPPYTHGFDLASVSEREKTIDLIPSAHERAAIATWLGAHSVDSFEAKVRIVRSGASHYRYEAEFAVGVTQACVITLEPVSSTLEGDFHRSFRVEPKLAPTRLEAAASRSRRIDVLANEEDEPELLASSEIDLAAPILEELALALDPYPRAPGAELPAPEAAALPAESPFAVLEKLKQPQSAAPKQSGKTAKTSKPKSKT